MPSVSPAPRYYALIPAAGSGARFGAEMPKQYLLLAGVPLLFHTLAALCGAPEIERVWVVLAADDPYWDQCYRGGCDWRLLGPKLETLHCGGATRAQSVKNGLAAAATAVRDEDWMLVHDAARPCLTSEMLERLFATVGDDPVGGLLAVPLADTLKRGGETPADGAPRVEATLPRAHLWQAQTPQMFRYGTLRAALERHPEVTDEAGAIEACGLSPLLVMGGLANLKVTYPGDLTRAECLLDFARGNQTESSAECWTKRWPKQ